jgi:ABC-2 type transport system permease protein
MLARILALITKEFLTIFKDKRSRFLVIVPPIIQLLVFGYAATFDLMRIKFAVYDEDKSSLSRELIAKFTGSTHFKLVKELNDSSEIEYLLDSRQVLMILHIGPLFSRRVINENNAPVQVIVDGRNSNTAAILLGYVNSIITDLNDKLFVDRYGRSLPLQLQNRSWFNPNLESRWFIVPALVGVLALVVVVLVTALSVATEREHGTFDQLLVAPFRPVEILIGKSLPGVIIGIFEASIILALSILWFKIPFHGSLLILYGGLLVFLMSVVAMGLMISSFAVTQQQGLLGGFLFIIPSITLSGFATPIANMPILMQKLTYFNPLRYFLVILRATFLEGASFNELIHQFWPMALIGLVSFSLAGWMFRHRLY